MTHTIGMISLGCAKNQVNAEHMLWLLRQAGYEISPDPDGAELVIVNTCGFIESAKTEAIDNILAMAQLKAEGQNSENSRHRLSCPALSGGDSEGAAGGRRRAWHGLVLRCCERGRAGAVRQALQALRRY
ncbi:MAG: hypothetical protein ACLUN5_14190 [Oscillospiraceae bacterium]